MRKSPTVKIERLPAPTLDQIEAAYRDRDAAQAKINELTKALPKASPAERAARAQSRDDDRLLNDFDRRLRQVCALGDLLVDAHCPVGADASSGASDVLAGPSGWRVLSVVSDMIRALQDDWDNRIQHLMSEGRKAELAIGLAKAGVKVRL